VPSSVDLETLIRGNVANITRVVWIPECIAQQKSIKIKDITINLKNRWRGK